nr:sodium:alanine symporter family protein [uncultured Cetobacterium sp.]
MGVLKSIIDMTNGLLWGKNILVVMLIGTALYITFKTRFMQVRLFGDIVKTLNGEKVDGEKISSLEAFYIGTACRVGAGNIAGVIAALSVGGPGALFWMWLVAILGASTSYIESVLAFLYREKDEQGNYRGGTPWILKNRYNMKKMGGIFAISSIVCYMGVIQVTANSVTESVVGAYSLDKTWVSIGLALVVAITIFGKSKKDRIVTVINKIVPLMAFVYLAAVLYVILTNLAGIPAMFGTIVKAAFGGDQLLGGAMGAVVMQGVRRGLFSNEAGSGNSNYAAALADTDEASKQGLVQSLGVYVDTLIICSATAFVVLLADSNATEGLSGMVMFQEALRSHIGWIGIPLTVVALFFFSFSTILGVTFYGKNALTYLSEGEMLNNIYKVIVIAMVYIGGIQQNFFVWSLADFGLGIMTVINILTIFPIIGEGLKELEKYEQKIKGCVKINP